MSSEKLADFQYLPAPPFFQPKALDIQVNYDLYRYESSPKALLRPHTHPMANDGDDDNDIPNSVVRFHPSKNLLLSAGGSIVAVSSMGENGWDTIAHFRETMYIDEKKAATLRLQAESGINTTELEEKDNEIEINDLLWLDDIHFAVCGTSGCIRIVNIVTTSVERSLHVNPTPKVIYTIASPSFNSELIFAGTSNGSLYAWNWVSGELILKYERMLPSDILSLSFIIDDIKPYAYLAIGGLFDFVDVYRIPLIDISEAELMHKNAIYRRMSIEYWESFRLYSTNENLNGYGHYPGSGVTSQVLLLGSNFILINDVINGVFVCQLHNSNFTFIENSYPSFNYRNIPSRQLFHCRTANVVIKDKEYLVDVGKLLSLTSDERTKICHSLGINDATLEKVILNSKRNMISSEICFNDKIVCISNGCGQIEMWDIQEMLMSEENEINFSWALQFPHYMMTEVSFNLIRHCSISYDGRFIAGGLDGNLVSIWGEKGEQ